MKKLFYIANVRLPTEKAHGIQIMEMCQAFSDHGMEVELIVPKRKTIEENPYHYYGVRENFKITRLWCLDWVRLGRIGFLVESFTFAMHGVWYSLNKDGIFYSRDEMVAVLLEAFGKRAFWEAHMGHKNLFSALAIKFRLPIVVITEGLRKAYIAMGAEEKNILVSPDAVNLQKFRAKESKEEARERLGLEKGKKIILYSGHLYRWKGVETLAEAARLSAFDATFLFVGGSDKHVRDFKERHAKEKNILVLGRKPLQEIPLYLKAADALVLPNSSKEEISRSYTSPLKLFEYMASGTPIVASELPSIREIISEKEATFFEPDNEERLAQALAESLNYPEEAQKKASRAFEKVKEYTWANRADKILNFIK